MLERAWFSHSGRATSVVIFGLILLLALDGAVKAQEIVWARGGGGSGGDIGSEIAIDASGNCYVTGRFEGSATFGVGEANETTLTVASSATFLAKYDVNGTLIWVKQVGQDSRDARSAIALDGSGNIYLSGCFRGNAIFGAGEANETTLSSSSYSIFVAKYASDGGVVWATQAGGDATDGAYGITTDASGNSYVTGIFEGSATFGASETNETTLNSAGLSDIFIAKYDVNGLLQWAKRAGGEALDGSHDIEIDANDRCYLTGFFAGSATFGMAEANETTLDGAGSLDFFVAQYNAEGLLQWVRNAIDDSEHDVDEGLDLALDGSGNSYLTGCFVGNATFGAGEAATTLTSAGSADIFLAKYDVDGGLQWVEQVGGLDFDLGHGVEVDASGSIYVTGRMEGSVTFGAGEPNEATLNSAGSSDIFFSKYDTNGLLLWVKQAGGQEFDGGGDTALDAAGNCYLTGFFEASATFGPGDANETILIGAGPHDFFVAKYRSGMPTRVDKTRTAATNFTLAQNYPNPFNPETTITFEVSKAVPAILAVYNLKGQLVRTILSEEIAPGTHRVLWDGTDGHGGRVATGVYVYRLQTPNFVTYRKMIRVR